MAQNRNSSNDSQKTNTAGKDDSTMSLDASADKIKDSVQSAISNVISNMEPQLNEFAGKIAQEAVLKSKDYAAVAVRRVQKQPWYLVGFAALLLIGAALFLGFQAADMDEEEAGVKH
jgi:ElaB/YqjD/DUF883 family membrane-anchored ribosome-binding protein